MNKIVDKENAAKSANFLTLAGFDSDFYQPAGKKESRLNKQFNFCVELRLKPIQFQNLKFKIYNHGRV